MGSDPREGKGKLSQNQTPPTNLIPLPMQTHHKAPTVKLTSVYYDILSFFLQLTEGTNMEMLSNCN